MYQPLFYRMRKLRLHSHLPRVSQLESEGTGDGALAGRLVIGAGAAVALFQENFL